MRVRGVLVAALVVATLAAVSESSSLRTNGSRMFSKTPIVFSLCPASYGEGWEFRMVKYDNNAHEEPSFQLKAHSDKGVVNTVAYEFQLKNAYGNCRGELSCQVKVGSAVLAEATFTKIEYSSLDKSEDKWAEGILDNRYCPVHVSLSDEGGVIKSVEISPEDKVEVATITATAYTRGLVAVVRAETGGRIYHPDDFSRLKLRNLLGSHAGTKDDPLRLKVDMASVKIVTRLCPTRTEGSLSDMHFEYKIEPINLSNYSPASWSIDDLPDGVMLRAKIVDDRHENMRLLGMDGSLVVRNLEGSRFDVDVYASTLMDRGTMTTYSVSIDPACQVGVQVYVDDTEELMWSGDMVLKDTIATLKHNLRSTAFAGGEVKIKHDDDWVIISEENDDAILAKYRNMISNGKISFRATAQKASHVRVSICPQAASYRIRLLEWDLVKHGGFPIVAGEDFVEIDHVELTFESGHSENTYVGFKVPLEGKWTGQERSPEDIMKQVNMKPKHVGDRIPEKMAVWTNYYHPSKKKLFVEVDNSECTVSVSFLTPHDHIFGGSLSRVGLSATVADIKSGFNGQRSTSAPMVKHLLKDHKPASDIVSVIDLLRSETGWKNIDTLSIEAAFKCPEERMFKTSHDTVSCQCEDTRSFGDRCQYFIHMHGCPMTRGMNEYLSFIGVFASSWRVPSSMVNRQLPSTIEGAHGGRVQFEVYFSSPEGDEHLARLMKKIYWDGITDYRRKTVKIHDMPEGSVSIELEPARDCTATVNLYEQVNGDPVYTGTMSRWATIGDVINEANLAQPPNKRIEGLLVYEKQVRPPTDQASMNEKRVGSFPKAAAAFDFVINKYEQTMCLSVRLYKSTLDPIPVCAALGQTTRNYEASYNSLIPTSPVLFVDKVDPFKRLLDSPVTEGMEVLAVTKATWTYMQYFTGRVSRSDIEKAIDIGNGDILDFTYAANLVMHDGKRYTSLDFDPISEQLKKVPTKMPCRSDSDCNKSNADRIEFCQVKAPVSSIYHMEPYCAFAASLGSIPRREFDIGAQGKSSLRVFTDIYHYMIPTTLRSDDDEVVPFPSSWTSRDFGKTYGYNCDEATKVLDQTNCGTCWAYATASTISQHMCIATKGAFNQLLSVGSLTARAWNLKLGFTNDDYKFHDSDYDIEKNPYMRRFGSHGGHSLNAMSSLAQGEKGGVPEICRPSICEKGTKARAAIFAELLDLYQTARVVPKADELVNLVRASNKDVSENTRLKWTVARAVQKFKALRGTAKKARKDAKDKWAESSFYAPPDERLRETCSDESIVPSILLDKEKPSITYKDFVSDYMDAMDKIYHHLRFKGPVAVALMMDLENYFAMVDDVYLPKTFMPKTNHAVTVVGWGEQMASNGKIIRYWLIQNSYGTTWSSGHEGYFKVQRGFDSECVSDLLNSKSAVGIDRNSRAENLLEGNCGMDFFFMLMLSHVQYPTWVPVVPILAQSSVDSYVALGESCGRRRCEHGGLLVPGECKCVCPVAFTGSRCESCVPKACGPGEVQDPQSCECACKDGFFGENCSESIEFALCTNEDGDDIVRVAKRQGSQHINQVGLLDDIGVKTNVNFKYGLGSKGPPTSSLPMKKGRWSKAFILDSSQRDEFGKVRRRTVYLPLIDHGAICHTALTAHGSRGDPIKIDDFLPHQTLKELSDHVVGSYGGRARVKNWRGNAGILSEDTTGEQIPVGKDGRRHILFDVECVGRCGPNADFDDKCECVCNKYLWGPSCSYSAILGLCPVDDDASKVEVVVDSLLIQKNGMVKGPLQFVAKDGSVVKCDAYLFEEPTSFIGKKICTIPAGQYVDAYGKADDGRSAYMRMLPDTPFCNPGVLVEGGNARDYVRADISRFDLRKSLSELKDNLEKENPLRFGKVIHEFVHPQTGESLGMDTKGSDLPISGGRRNVHVRLRCGNTCPSGMQQDEFTCKCSCLQGTWGDHCENSAELIVCGNLLYVFENNIAETGGSVHDLKLTVGRHSWTCEGYVFPPQLSPPGALLCEGKDIPSEVRYGANAVAETHLGEVKIPIRHGYKYPEFCSKHQH